MNWYLFFRLKTIRCKSQPCERRHSEASKVNGLSSSNKGNWETVFSFYSDLLMMQVPNINRSNSGKHSRNSWPPRRMPIFLWFRFLFHIIHSRKTLTRPDFFTNALSSQYAYTKKWSYLTHFFPAWVSPIWSPDLSQRRIAEATALAGQSKEPRLVARAMVPPAEGGGLSARRPKGTRLTASL